MNSVWNVFLIHIMLYSLKKTVLFFQKQGHFKVTPNFRTVVNIHTYINCYFIILFFLCNKIDNIIGILTCQHALVDYAGS